MARYIDADKIEWHEQLEPFGNGKYEYCRVVYMDDIDDIPPADVRENVHGEWIESSPNTYTKRVNCSNCGSSAPFVFVSAGDVYSTNGNHGEIRKTYFCPNCGADMRGEKDGEI